MVILCPFIKTKNPNVNKTQFMEVDIIAIYYGMSVDCSVKIPDLESRPQPSRLRPRTWPLRPRTRTRTWPSVSRPRSWPSRPKTWPSRPRPRRRNWPPRPRQDGVKANVNMVRCSVKTSNHRRLLQNW